MKTGIVKSLDRDGYGLGGYCVEIETGGVTESYTACWLNETTAASFEFLARNELNLLERVVQFCNLGNDLVFIDFLRL